MISKKQILAFLLIFSFGESIGCLNGETKHLKSGPFLYVDSEGKVPYGHEFFESEDMKRDFREMDSLYRVSKDLDYLSDKGILLIVQGRYKEAIDLYLEIERLEPNRYSTASNIGTAYELIGDNENALKWIKKAVEINSASHQNSEWIHVNILEAKIKGESFYTTKHLLNTDFGTEKAPSSTMSKEELEALHKALYYQLNERVSFVKENDKIVAQLLFDLGNIAFLLGELNDAFEDYKRAQYYGFTGELLGVRISESQNETESRQSGSLLNKYGPAVIGLAFLAAMIWFVRRVISSQMND